MQSSTTFENDDWAVTLSGIPVELPLPGVPVEELPSEKDMGKGEPDTIIYVNLKSKKIPEKFKGRIKELTEMLDTTHQWLDVHAGL